MAGDDLYARLAERLTGVDGWLHPAEAVVLYSAAQRAVQADPSALVVEIGSWLGRSAIALGLAVAESGGTTPVHAVDPHLLYPDSDIELARVDRVPLLKANLEAAGLTDHVRIVQTTSAEAGPDYADSSVSVLFIDADHNYDGIATDIKTWKRTLKPGAFVMFNDHWMEGVTAALLELVATRDSGFCEPSWVVNSVCFRYRPDKQWTAADTAALRRVRLLLRGGRAFKDLRRSPRTQVALPQKVLARVGSSVIGPLLYRLVPPAVDEVYGARVRSAP